MGVRFIDNPHNTTKFRQFKSKIRYIVGQAVTNQAKKDCPVDTSRLRESLAYRVIPGGVIIYDQTNYGIFPEMGTVKQRAQPFLRPAPAKAWKSIVRQAKTMMR